MVSLNSVVVLVVYAGTLFQGSQAVYKFPTTSNDALMIANDVVWKTSAKSADKDQWKQKFLDEGTGIFHAVEAFLKGEKPKIIVLASYGGNGGSGIQASVLFQREKYIVKVYYLKDYYFDEEKKKAYSKACEDLLTSVEEHNKDEFKITTKIEVAQGDIVIDGICGTGYAKPKQEDVKLVPFAALRQLQQIGTGTIARVVAIDIVSGMNKFGKFEEIDGFAPAAIIHIGFPKYYLEVEAANVPMIDRDPSTEHYLVFYKAESLFPLLSPSPSDFCLIPGPDYPGGVEQRNAPPTWREHYEKWLATARGGAKFVCMLP